MGNAGSSLVSSAPRRVLEDIWSERLGHGVLWANEEAVRVLLEQLLRCEAVREPEVLSLVVVCQFFPGGASLNDLLDKEVEVRDFLQTGRFEQDADVVVQEEDDDDDDDDIVAVRGSDLFVSSEIFAEPVDDKRIVASVPRNALAHEFLIAATSAAFHCLYNMADLSEKVQEA